eukprot:TRINITY_DN19642_c1_g1_i1.p1 TRINITY_DN19642_c1_g1~~TRINITY_DN19642_c1_g1_i1.p1  ORF type:complete len:332 (+),score=106.28 TRINITY_DN19642_c1_g1_i1:368-1363(+)
MIADTNAMLAPCIPLEPEEGEDTLVQLIAGMLDSFTQTNDRIVATLPSEQRPGNQKAQSFVSFARPTVSITDYVRRIHRYCQASTECFLVALILVDRLIHKQQDLFMCSMNVHRLFSTAVLLAIKCRDDMYYTNKFYAQVYGQGLKEINFLEREMLVLLDFDLHVTMQDYGQFLSEIGGRYAGSTGLQGRSLTLFEYYRKVFRGAPTDCTDSGDECGLEEDAESTSAALPQLQSGPAFACQPSSAEMMSSSEDLSPGHSAVFDTEGDTEMHDDAYAWHQYHNSCPGGYQDRWYQGYGCDPYQQQQMVQQHPGHYYDPFYGQAAVMMTPQYA